ncbi:MAG: malonyl-ACP O-methyltransferase BioC [Pseudomonadota bacterium]|jgi:malonyl-CoA O-methyltransferase
MSAAQTPAQLGHGGISPTQIARSFGQAAARYDDFADLQRDVADHLLASIAITRVDTALDLGCGTGYCTRKLGARFPQAHLIALDLALPMLHATAMRAPQGTHLLCADMQAVPLRDASADLAVSSLTLQWCTDPRRVFADLARMLRPGGQALISTFGPATLRELHAAWRAADAHVHANRFLDAGVLQAAAESVGLTIRLEQESKVRYYASLRALAQELKGIGAHNMNSGRARGLTAPAAFARAEQAFSNNSVLGQGVPVTWELYYLDLRKPA